MMKIPPIGVPNAIQQYKRTVRVPETQDELIMNDRVDISESAQSFAAVLRAAQKSSEIDPARLEQLRASVQDGTYQIDGQLVAQKMLSGITLNDFG